VRDDEYLMHACRGNESAFHLCKLIIEISGTWDDLVDRDVDVPVEHVNRMMHAALISIPRNAFYRKHLTDLQPVIEQSIINWHLANSLEPKAGIGREIAHVQRYAAADILIYVTALCGGVSWAREVGPEIRLRCQRDCFLNYHAEMEKKHAA